MRVLIIFSMLLLLFTTACSAPQADLLDAPVTKKIKTGIKQGTKTFDHSSYDALLKKHVNTKTLRVDYAGFKKDSQQLDTYLTSLGNADLTKLKKPALLAFLINAYNAYTIKLILENYPGIKSIRKIDKPWDQKKYKVGGDTLSLNNIEHGLLRPIFKDPRIHFVVNCASIGCPPLRAEAFTADRVNAQMEASTNLTLKNKAYVRVEGDTLKLNPIMKWYGEDFTNKSYRESKKSVAEFVQGYATDEVAAFIKKHNGEPTVEFLDYDWNLNDKK